MWFFYALFFAVWSSIATFFIKGFTKTTKPLPMLFALGIIAVFFDLAIILLSGGIPNFTLDLFKFMFTSAVLDTTAFLASITAISLSPISLLAPLSSFGAVFTTLIAIFTLHEFPTIPKLIGIILVVVGAYLLNIGDIKSGFLKPFEHLMRSRGAKLYLLSTFLFSITPIFQKKAIFETTPTTPLFASFVGICFVTIFIFPFAIRHLGEIRSMMKQNYKVLPLFGLFGALSQLAAYSAFAQANVGYVSAIFRLDTLFIIFLGGKFLKEERISERLLGAVVMIAGVLLIALKV